MMNILYNLIHIIVYIVLYIVLEVGLVMTKQDIIILIIILISQLFYNCIGGPINTSAIFETVDKMFEVNTHSALSASYVASHHLSPNGLLVITGAAAALNGTPSMLSYGLSKA